MLEDICRFIYVQNQINLNLIRNKSEKLIQSWEKIVDTLIYDIYNFYKNFVK